MANPNLIGGGRMTRSEVSGDRRKFSNTPISKTAVLRRFWRYLHRKFRRR